MERPARYGSRPRRASTRVRRRRAAVGAAMLLLVVVLVTVVVHPGGSRPSATPRTTGTARAAGATGGGQVTATVLAARLPSPLSREATVAIGHGEVLLLGGLTAADTSSSGVAVLSTATGKVSDVGTLAVPTHDAGGAPGRGSAFLFGGGQATSVATVQAFPTPVAGATTASPPVATVVGQMPTARSDDAAVAVGGTDYVVGGYDGTVGEPDVLATTDGHTFRKVATLPVPVRYPAVAELGGLLYVFGGQAVTGPQAGQPVDDVQVVDPARHTARLAGHLGQAVAGAAAADLGGRLYVAGGDAAPAPGAPPGATPVTVATVWRYDPRRGTSTVVAHLPVAVSHPGVAVSGTAAWLIGGETDGTVGADVQRLAAVRRR